jgi:hypothetical protein
MASHRYVPHVLSLLAVVALCLYGTGCPVNEPIAGDAGPGGTSGGAGTTSTGGVSGFVGDTGGGPVTGTEDGSSGITGRQ